MDIITELLNLEDADITVSDIRIEGTKKILTLDTLCALLPLLWFPHVFTGRQEKEDHTSDPPGWL